MPTGDAPRSGWGGAGIVIGVTLAVSFALAVVLAYRYSAAMVYIKHTLEERSEPWPWELTPYAPEQCVDASMQWAAECHGVKSLCDIYVERVVLACMMSSDRHTYCQVVGDAPETTEFGAAECRDRGVQRNVDREACANIYRTVGEYCRVELLGLEPELP